MPSALVHLLPVPTLRLIRLTLWSVVYMIALG